MWSIELVRKRRTSPETRRSELIAAATSVFFTKGVTNSAVSDIVKAAGLAQGTFYLYFKSKTDIVNAVAEHMVDGMVDAIERTVAPTDTGALAKLMALFDAIRVLVDDEARRELADIYHRPENHVVHQRMTERIVPRLVPLVESIVKQGVAESVFTAENPKVATWFILGGLHMLEVGFTDRAELPAAITDAMHCALRALGHAGEITGPSASH